MTSECESCNGIFRISPRVKCRNEEDNNVKCIIPIVNDKTAVLKFQSWLEYLNPYFNFDILDTTRLPSSGVTPTKKRNANDNIDSFLNNFSEMLAVALFSYKTSETICLADVAIKYLLESENNTFRNVLDDTSFIGFLEIGCRNMDNSHHVAQRFEGYINRSILAQGVDFKMRREPPIRGYNNTGRGSNNAEREISEYELPPVTIPAVTTPRSEDIEDDANSSHSDPAIIEIYRCSEDFKIPYPDDSLSVVLLTDVLFSVPDVRTFLIDITYKLKNGSVLIINNEECENWIDAYYLDVKYCMIASISNDYLPIYEYRSRDNIKNILLECGYELLSTSGSAFCEHYKRYVDVYYKK